MKRQLLLVFLYSTASDSIQDRDMHFCSLGKKRHWLDHYCSVGPHRNSNQTGSHQVTHQWKTDGGMNEAGRTLGNIQHTCENEI
jgi:hypothetical protein